MAPSAAVISSALVTSNAKTQREKRMLAMPWMLPSELASESPTTAPSAVWLRATTSTTPSSSPAAVAISRWPLMVSTTESDASTPTSISTNRNSIRIAPV